MRDAVGRVESVLVLGGTSDIGVAIARELIARGARRVLLAGRDDSSLKHAASTLGAAVETLSFDAEDPSSHDAVVRDAFSRGDVDVVVFAFGVLGDQQNDEHNALEALRVARVNYDAVVTTAIPVADRLRAQGHGAMVLLSSVAAERARRANFVYGSAKAGADAFFQGLSYALHGSGVHVLIARPGFVRTKMTHGRAEAPFAATAPEVARAVADGLERKAPVVYVPPLLRWVMLVLRNLPRAMMRLLKS
jgi:decaprenylphospho-beta-D-erythro-pentofuranosid-2-ulose 2-reductase